MSKIVITGGAGFIGHHLVKHFLDLGDEVICIDNFLSGSKGNIESFLDNPRFTLIEHDVINPLPELPAGIDAIFHLACPASPNPESPVSYMNFPVETMMVNTVGTQNVLELARREGAQIILASTSEVYGDPLEHPQSESYRGNVSSTGIRSCYDEGKRALEALSFAHHRLYQTKVKVVRIFNTYGPGMRLDDGRFTINLIDAHVNNKSFKIFGDGSSTRSFCYIDDLIAGLVKAYGADQAVGEVINLGNPEEIKLNDAIQIFEKIAAHELVKEASPALPDDPKRRCPDISKAKEVLGWEPTTSFEEGIKKTLDFYEKN